MPITSSAKKALKRNKKQKSFNDVFRNNMKGAIRDLRQKVKKGEKVAVTEIQKIYSVIDKALKARVIHKKTAARRKSRIAIMLNKLSA